MIVTLTALLSTILLWGILHDLSLVKRTQRLDNVEIDGGSF